MKNNKKVLLRDGSVHGSKHRRLGLNNQDARLHMTFSIPAFGKTFHVGLLSDGCTGNPLFSRTEVGANLLVVYAYRRIQEILCTGTSVVDLPKVLFPTITEFVVDLCHKIMPATVYWPYLYTPAGRKGWSSSTRFRNDYLAATLLGFATDEEDLVLFSAGDGLFRVNDELIVIDQNDQPDYPAISINQAGKGFEVKTYRFEKINRLVLASDGLNKLIEDLEFVQGMFDWQEENPLGLQFWLNLTFEKSPELMKDDCTAVILEKIGG